MINDNFTELYALTALFSGTGIKFIIKVIDASHNGDFIAGAVTVIPAPGAGKAIKVIDAVLFNDPTTPLDIGTQIMNVCYGNPPDGTSQDIGYFPSYYLKSATKTLAGMVEPTSAYKGIFENQAVGVGLSADADITSGSAVLVIFMWYYEISGVAGIVGPPPGPPPKDSPIMTTITASPVTPIDGSEPTYVCAHPTNPIALLLDDTATKGEYNITNLGVAQVSLQSLTGPGTVLINGNAEIYLNQNESIKIDLVNLDATPQFIVKNGPVNLGA
jgi:hypothetical protein